MKYRDSHRLGLLGVTDAVSEPALAAVVLHQL